MGDIGSIFSRFYEDLLAGLDIRSKRIAWLSGLIVLLVLVVAALWVYESVSGSMYFYSLERKVELLEKLQTLSQAGIASDGELYPVYQTIISEVDAWKVTPLAISLFGTYSIFGWLGKFVAGAWIGVICALISFLTDRRKPHEERKPGAFYGFLAWGIIGGIISVPITTGFNWIVMPIVSLVVFFALGSLGGWMTARKNSKAKV